ncbi:MAG: site-specific integrase [Paludibacter sp.]
METNKEKEISSKLYYSGFGVTINVTRDSRRKDTKESCPLKWCVTYQRKRSYFKTDISLNGTDWTLFLKESKVKKIQEITDSLQTYFDSVLKSQIKTLSESGTFTFDSLNKRLSKNAGDNLFDAYDIKIENMKAEGRIGNASFYQCSKNSIVAYTDKKLKISDISISWLNGYYKHLIGKGISYATMGMYLRSLRVILNDAVINGVITENSYPFGKGKFVIPTAKGRDLSLELTDIKRIAEYNCQSKTTEMCRDLWIFSYLANGINFGDMLTLKFENIKNNEISFKRAKTIRTSTEKIDILIPILEPLQDIINKWGNARSPKKYIFPFLNDCKTETDRKREILNVIRLTNKHIKRVTTALKMDDISTYNARHSFATILTKKRVPESYISESLGHSKNKTVTQNYFGSYNKKERIKYNSLLIWGKGRTRTFKTNIRWKK